MSANDLLKKIYTKFYNLRSVLKEAPQLTQDPTGRSFDFAQADSELAKLISWMMGVHDIQKESFEHAIKIIQEHYATQPQWKELLAQYFEYTLQKEQEETEAQESVLLKEIEEFTQKLLAGEIADA